MVLVAIGGVSCKKFLDINTSPLTANKVQPNLLFGYAITAWDANKNSGDLWLPTGLFAQNIASGGDFGWEKSNVYDLSPFTLGNTWKVFYSTAGNNLQLAIRDAESAVPANNNTAAQCKIVLAQMIYEATTLYGDVPYTEAWQADKFPYPKYDAQKDVLEGLLKLLDEASAQIDPASPLKITDYDIYYKGDMTKWKKVANSIKFKILMLMVDKDPTKASQVGQMLANAADMIASPADSWLHPYYDKTNNENPKYRLFKTYTDGENQWFFANSFVFDYMQPKDDPRIPRFFDKGEDATDYKSVKTEELADETTSLISAYIYRKNAPSLILTYQEIALLQAEAYARGLGVTQDLATAQTLFSNGVKASMDFYESDATAVSTYLTTQLPVLAISVDPVKDIHTQQWIDLMDRPLEAFTQWRRSGSDGNEFPALTLPLDATAGPLIRRFELSPDETTANPNIPTPQPKYFDKMWFDL